MTRPKIGLRCQSFMNEMTRIRRPDTSPSPPAALSGRRSATASLVPVCGVHSTAAPRNSYSPKSIASNDRIGAYIWSDCPSTKA